MPINKTNWFLFIYLPPTLAFIFNKYWTNLKSDFQTVSEQFSIFWYHLFSLCNSISVSCIIEYLFVPSHLYLVYLVLFYQASDMMTARGSLELCYDEFNRAYRTPLFCFTDPDNLIDMNSPPKILSQGLDFLKSCSQSTFCPQPINIKLRINPGDFNLRILILTSDSISDLKHYIFEQSLNVRTIVLDSTVQYCIVLHCIGLYHIMMHCTVSYDVVLYYAILYCVILYCVILWCIVFTLV